MTPVITFQPIMMRSVGDCALCCLVMICGKSYAEVLSAVPRGARKLCVGEGLSVVHTCLVARRLGTTLEYYDGPEEDDEAEWETFTDGDNVGLLNLERTTGEDGHMVVYLKGIVYDPAAGEVWSDVDAYLAQRNWRVEGFLWRKK